MSARGSPNLRLYVVWGVKKAGKLGYRRKLWVDVENCAEWRH